jgi:hypothetical protein
LRAYSHPVALSTFSPDAWITGVDAWEIAEKLCDVRHYPLISKYSEKYLRPIEEIERRLVHIRAFTK